MSGSTHKMLIRSSHIKDEPREVRLVKSGESTPRFVIIDNENEEKSPLEVKSAVSLAGSSLDGALPGTRMVFDTGSKLSVGSLPPRLCLTPKVRNVYRFRCTTSGTYTITVPFILGSLGGIAGGATAVTPWSSSFKLVKVTVWPAPSSSAAVTTTLSWGIGQADQVPDELDDRSIPEGTTITAPLVFRPPAMSLAQFWINDSSSATICHHRYRRIDY
jgi:hypothetical protein